MFSSRVSASVAGAVPERASVFLARPVTVGSIGRFRRAKAQGAARRSDDALETASALIGEMETAPDHVLPVYGQLGAIALGRTLNALRDEMTAYVQYVQHLSDADSGGARLLSLRFSRAFDLKLEEARKLAERTESRIESSAPSTRDAFESVYQSVAAAARKATGVPQDSRAPTGGVQEGFNAQISRIEHQAVQLVAGEHAVESMSLREAGAIARAGVSVPVAELADGDLVDGELAEVAEHDGEEAPRV